MKVLFRRIVSKESRTSKLAVEHDGLYLSKLRVTRDTVKTPFQAMLDRVEFFRIYHASRIRSALPVDPLAATLMVVTWLIATLAFGVLLIGAVANDAFNTTDAPAWLRAFFGDLGESEYHQKTRGALLTSMIGSLGLPVAVQIGRDMRNRAHYKTVKSFKGGANIPSPRDTGLSWVALFFAFSFILFFYASADTRLAFLGGGAVGLFVGAVRAFLPRKA